MATFQVIRFMWIRLRCLFDEIALSSLKIYISRRTFFFKTTKKGNHLLPQTFPYFCPPKRNLL